MLAIKTLTPKSIIYRREVRLMGERFEIGIVGNNPGWAEEQIDAAIAEISRVEKLLSTFSDESIINEINRNAGVKPVKTDGEIFKLIDRSLEISELTYGSFDITYYVADKEDGNAIPAKTTIGYKNIVLDASAQTVFLKHKGMRIGFAANSKGYAADRAKYVLQLQGVSSGVINAGGDLLTWGNQPDNEPWTVAAAAPSQKNQPFADLNISNMAIATSVNTEKYKAISAKKSLNAINSKKGFPISGIKSVSIISTVAELADAMASPVMSMGINAGLYMINQLNQVACIVIDDHDRIYNSKDINF